jgi:hypothetical protein
VRGDEGNKMLAYELTNKQKALRKVLDQIRLDFIDACISWSFWEGANGFPLGSRRQVMSSLINETQEGYILYNNQRLAFITTTLALNRMIDSAGANHGQDRLSLGKVAYLINDKKLSEFIISSAGVNSVCQITNVRKTYSETEFFYLWKTLCDNNAGMLNLSNLRTDMKNLRDGMIAHSLDGAAESKISARLVRRILIFCGLQLKKLYLVYLGVNFDPKHIWKNSLKDGQKFWDRYKMGFKYHPD